jgi:hypothetical protein
MSAGRDAGPPNEIADGQGANSREISDGFKGSIGAKSVANADGDVQGAGPGKRLDGGDNGFSTDNFIVVEEGMGAGQGNRCLRKW